MTGPTGASLTGPTGPDGTPGTQIQSGLVALTGGVVTISYPVTSGMRIFVMRNNDIGTIGASYSIDKIIGSGFTVTAKTSTGATQLLDNSLIAWMILA
jgi:hypothetical protein